MRNSNGDYTINSSTFLQTIKVHYSSLATRYVRNTRDNRDVVSTRLLVHKHVKISVEGWILETNRPHKHVTIFGIFELYFVSVFMSRIELEGKYYYRPQRSCGQGYVFTRVCDSVNTPRRRLLLRTVSILLECILVLVVYFSDLFTFKSFAPSTVWKSGFQKSLVHLTSGSNSLNPCMCILVTVRLVSTLQSTWSLLYSFSGTILFTKIF